MPLALAAARRAAAKLSRPPRAVGQEVAAPLDAEEVRSSLYPFKDIEKKWQAHWEANKTFRTPAEACHCSIITQPQFPFSCA